MARGHTTYVYIYKRGKQRSCAQNTCVDNVNLEINFLLKNQINSNTLKFSIFFEVNDDIDNFSTDIFFSSMIKNINKEVDSFNFEGVNELIDISKNYVNYYSTAFKT